jgi:glycosyltransferase involved in cell wall biosynthesis
MLKISVIIPVYNGEKTIGETIASVLKQTYKNWEILVIDDGSQDATLEVLREINDPRLNVFSYPNAGQAVSRNRGIELARGEYIAFLDADDLWTPDKLETQLKALQENPQAAVAYSWTDYIDESGQFVQSGRHITINGDVYAALLVNNFLENGSNVLIRQQALTEVGGFEASLPPAEDWDLWLRLAKCYHFVAVPAPQVLYRVSPTSSSSNLAKQEIQCLRVIDRAFARAPNSLQYLKRHSLANLYKYLAWKALDSGLTRGNGVTALRLTWNYIKYEPALLKEAKFASIMVLKSAIAALLPPQQAKMVFAQLKKSD